MSVRPDLLARLEACAVPPGAPGAVYLLPHATHTRFKVGWSVPLFASKEIISWALAPDAQALAVFNRIPLRVLGDVRVGGPASAKPAAAGGNGDGGDCPSVTVTPMAQIPTVQLLLDRSGSMDAGFGGGLNRWQAVRAALTALFDFTIPDASKTITLTVANDAGDALFTIPIDVAHGTTTAGADPAHGAGAVPLVVGPYAEQGNNNPLPYRWIVSTDAASLSLVSASVGALWSEVVTQTTTTVTVTP